MHFSTKAVAAVSLGSVLTVGTGVAGAGTAGAAGDKTGRVAVQPDPAWPNEHVSVSEGGQCPAATATGTASSMGFSAPAALRRSGDRLAGSTTIRSGARGTYPVIVACGKTEVSGSARVIPKAAATPSYQPAAVVPKGPAPTADGTTSRGSDGTLAKTGLAVLVLGAVVGLLARHRRSRSRI